MTHRETIEVLDHHGNLQPWEPWVVKQARRWELHRCITDPANRPNSHLLVLKAGRPLGRVARCFRTSIHPGWTVARCVAGL